MAQNSQLPVHFGRFNSSRRLLLAAVLALIGTVFLGLQVGAVSQGYQAGESDLKLGMVVKLSDTSSPNNLAVQAADSTNQSLPLGVITQIDQSVLAIGSSVNNIFVTNSGQTDVFVSDLTGEIKKGDQLSVSPLKGVLQRTENQQVQVGTALQDFPTDSAESVTIKGADGNDKVVKTALISVNVDIKAVGQTSEKENWLQSVGRTITGRSTNEVRVVVAFIIFVALLVVEGVVLHSTISSTISAAGRNPMAKRLIEQQSFKGVLVAVIVLVTGIATISIILWV